MRKFLVVLFIATSVLCLASPMEAGQPTVYARVETGSGVWTVENGYMANKCWVLYLRTVNGTKLDAKPLGGGIGYASGIIRLQMIDNGYGGVRLLMVARVARRNWSRQGGSITDNNFNWSTRRIERRMIDNWQEPINP